MRIPPYAWPDNKKCAVLLSVLFDDGLDAVSKAPDLASRSKSFSVWEYGARRGVDRLLETLADFGVSSTWFVPGVVVEKHVSAIRDVASFGHHIEARGWAFEGYSSLDADASMEHLRRSIDVIERVTTRRPRGFRLPGGHWPRRFDKILRAVGINWSASLNGDDRPYSHPSGLVEIPVHLEMEDRPYFQFNFNPPFPKGLGRLPSYEGVLSNWKAEFDAYREHGLCFVLQIRPEMIATPGRIFVLKELLAHMQNCDDTWIATGDEIASWHSQNAASLQMGHPLQVFDAYRVEHGFND